ncbi:hypothetical protein SISNIDRAFT_462669 [Sistotremastrum niveocremeum HHB9708]|uniref:Uncharacterized protein n=1 Tax=Sistotremastrum niveocremeum HHB9708 TaxID=1314777 RepID=A0A164ZE62_9AGAM|nr:hypothetical protein SISNIDRAFT_462669 [Sistotremastrum niveocremeum HHB9708]
MCWVNGYPSRSACVAGLCSLPLGESLVRSAVVESLVRVRATVIQPHLPMAGLCVLRTESTFLFGLKESLVRAVDPHPGLNRSRCSLSSGQNAMVSSDPSERLVRASPHLQSASLNHESWYDHTCRVINLGGGVFTIPPPSSLNASLLTQSMGKWVAKVYFMTTLYSSNFLKAQVKSTSNSRSWIWQQELCHSHRKDAVA